MGMIVVMIRWVCFIDHAFWPATPPAHPGHRLPVGEESTAHVIDLDGLVEGGTEVIAGQHLVDGAGGHNAALVEQEGMGETGGDFFHMVGDHDQGGGIRVGC